MVREFDCEGLGDSGTGQETLPGDGIGRSGRIGRISRDSEDRNRQWSGLQFQVMVVQENSGGFGCTGVQSRRMAAAPWK